jgi:hypothetical protein
MALDSRLRGNERMGLASVRTGRQLALLVELPGERLTNSRKRPWRPRIYRPRLILNVKVCEQALTRWLPHAGLI